LASRTMCEFTLTFSPQTDHRQQSEDPTRWISRDWRRSPDRAYQRRHPDRKHGHHGHRTDAQQRLGRPTRRIIWHIASKSRQRLYLRQANTATPKRKVPQYLLSWRHRRYWITQSCQTWRSTSRRGGAEYRQHDRKWTACGRVQANTSGNPSQSWFREYSLASCEARAEADVHTEA
jgi:hypothetical protein